MQSYLLQPHETFPNVFQPQPLQQWQNSTVTAHGHCVKQDSYSSAFVLLRKHCPTLHYRSVLSFAWAGPLTSATSPARSTSYQEYHFLLLNKIKSIQQYPLWSVTCISSRACHWLTGIYIPISTFRIASHRLNGGMPMCVQVSYIPKLISQKIKCWGICMSLLLTYFIYLALLAN